MFSLFGWLKNKKLNRERILAFDLLRGTFLIVIITTHIAWRPSLFTFAGGGGLLFASAAEGFFAISGILVGYLYAPRILKDTKKIFIKIWKRAALLYFLATFFTFFYVAWAVLAGPDNIGHHVLYSREPWRFLVDTFTLRYAFGWAEFLNRYALFMLFAPFAVWLVAKGRAWIVAIVSLLVWLFLRETERFLPFSAWQLVFMCGIILGYYLPAIEEGVRSLSKKTRGVLFTVVVSAALISYAFSMYVFVIAPLMLPADSSVLQLHAQLAPLFDKNRLAPARVAIGVLWFAALYMVYRNYEKQISKKTHGVLEVFGRQSLFVYCLHAFILFMIDLYFRPPAQNLILLNTIVTFAVLAIIYILARYRSQLTTYGKKILGNKNMTTVP